MTITYYPHTGHLWACSSVDRLCCPTTSTVTATSTPRRGREGKREPSSSITRRTSSLDSMTVLVIFKTVKIESSGVVFFSELE